MALNQAGFSGRAGQFLKLGLRTFGKFHCGYLGFRRHTSVRWLFDNRRDGSFDLAGRFLCRQHRLVFLLHGTRSGNNYEPLPVRRPSLRRLVVRMSLGLPEVSGRHLALQARSWDREACTPACKSRVAFKGY